MVLPIWKARQRVMNGDGRRVPSSGRKSGVRGGENDRFKGKPPQRARATNRRKDMTK